MDTPDVDLHARRLALLDALHLDLFKLDLSAIVSEYIGETEKNLEQVFEAAAAVRPRPRCAAERAGAAPTLCGSGSRATQ